MLLFLGAAVVAQSLSPDIVFFCTDKTALNYVASPGARCRALCMHT